MEMFGTSHVGASGLNGDAYWLSTDHAVVAVADGASGAFDKVAASRACIEAIAPYASTRAGQSPLEYLQAGFQRANTRLIERSHQDGQISFGTLTMAVVTPGRLTVGAVGDSPAFLVAPMGTRRLLTPRKRYPPLIERHLVTADEVARAVAVWPAVLQSLLDEFLPMIVLEVATAEYRVQAGEVLLLCTDGVSDWIRPEEWPAFVHTGSPLTESCARMIAEVQARGPAQDDATVVAVRW